jgi:prenyl protein peptidase
MGLPRFWGRVEVPVVMGPEDMIKKEDTARSDSGAGLEVADGRLGLQWTVAYYVILVLGAYGFYANLWRLTESKNALVDFT